MKLNTTAAVRSSRNMLYTVAAPVQTKATGKEESRRPNRFLAALLTALSSLAA